MKLEPLFLALGTTFYILADTIFLYMIQHLTVSNLKREHKAINMKNAVKHRSISLNLWRGEKI